MAIKWFDSYFVSYFITILLLRWLNCKLITIPISFPSCVIDNIGPTFENINCCLSKSLMFFILNIHNNFSLLLYISLKKLSASSANTLEIIYNWQHSNQNDYPTITCHKKPSWIFLENSYYAFKCRCCKNSSVEYPYERSKVNRWNRQGQFETDLKIKRKQKEQRFEIHEQECDQVPGKD